MGADGSLVEHRGELEFRMALCRFDEFEREFFVYGNRFFRNDMFAVVHRLDCEGDVEIVRNGDDDGVDIRLFEKLVGIGEKLNLFGIVLFKLFGVDIADGGEFCVGELSDADNMSAAHIADADDADFYLVHVLNPYCWLNCFINNITVYADIAKAIRGKKMEKLYSCISRRSGGFGRMRRPVAFWWRCGDFSERRR